MSFLPVAERELRVLARQPRTYTSRALHALLAIVMSLGMLYAGFGGLFSAGAAGRTLFVILGLVAGVYVLLEGALLTGDCLSQEKREGTLGLLFLTNLRGYDVVTGKLIARTGSAAYCLLAALPALGIPLFLGGVTGQDFGRLMAALLNGLFVSACLGMLVSALCRQERRAFRLAVGGVVSWAFLVPAIGWGLALYQNSTAIHPLFLVVTPAGAFYAALQSGVPGAPLGYSYLGSLSLTHLAGWGLLAMASLLLPRTWRERGMDSATHRAATTLGHRTGSRRFKSQGPTPSLDWTRRTPRERSLGIWPLSALFLLAWAVGWIFAKSNWLSLPVFAATALLLHLGLLCLVLLQACRAPAEDQRSGVLEILLTTPAGEDIYLRSRLLALKRQCLGPLLLVLAADAGLMLAGCWQTGKFNWVWLSWLGAFAALITKLLLDLYVVSWVGFWQGLKAGNTSRAIRNTFFYVFLSKWVILLAGAALVGIVSQGQVFQSTAAGFVAAAAYPALTVSTLLHFAARAMSELQDDLRLLAVRAGQEEPPSWLARIRRAAQAAQRLLGVTFPWGKPAAARDV